MKSLASAASCTSLQQRAGLNRHGHRLLVDFEDTVHALQRQNDAAVACHAAADHAGATAERSDRHAAPAGELDDRDDLRGIGGADHEARPRVIFARDVGGVALFDVTAREQVRGADDRTQFFFKHHLISKRMAWMQSPP